MKTDWRYGTCTKYLAVPTVLPQLAGSRIDASGPCTLLPDGYRLQGELFYQALLKAYNDYVEY